MRLLSPSKRHLRSYFVQLDMDISDTAINKVAKGIEIKVENGTYLTQPCTVKKLSKPPMLPERLPPIRYRQNIPTSWVLITLAEGKNRQIRKMFAAVGFPVLRLVRVQIEDLKLGKLLPGQFYEIKQAALFELIKIDVHEKISTKKKMDSSKSKLPIGETMKKKNKITTRRSKKSSTKIKKRS